jgi:hypothetical protein
VSKAVSVTRWQTFIRPTEISIGFLGFPNTSGAGANEYTDAGCSHSTHGGSYRIGELVLFQCQSSEAVVSAIVGSQLTSNRVILEALHPADPGVDVRVLEITRPQAALPVA